jgi:hypothetical protein
VRESGRRLQHRYEVAREPERRCEVGMRLGRCEVGMRLGRRLQYRREKVREPERRCEVEMRLGRRLQYRREKVKGHGLHLHLATRGRPSRDEPCPTP